MTSLTLRKRAKRALSARSEPQAANVFELTFNYRFEAAHRFTNSCAESCATPHGHTWYAKAIFEAPETSLGSDDMALEFAHLKRAWKTFIQETADHSFMHHHADPILPALRAAIPLFRGLPFPGDPTTELVASLFFSKLRSMHEELIRKMPSARALRPVAVVIRETPTNSITYRARHFESSTLLKRYAAEWRAWWQDSDPTARHLEATKPTMKAGRKSSARQ